MERKRPRYEFEAVPLSGCDDPRGVAATASGRGGSVVAVLAGHRKCHLLIDNAVGAATEHKADILTPQPCGSVVGLVTVKTGVVLAVGLRNASVLLYRVPWTAEGGLGEPMLAVEVKPPPQLLPTPGRVTALAIGLPPTVNYRIGSVALAEMSDDTAAATAKEQAQLILAVGFSSGAVCAVPVPLPAVDETTATGNDQVPTAIKLRVLLRGEAPVVQLDLAPSLGREAAWDILASTTKRTAIAPIVVNEGRVDVGFDSNQAVAGARSLAGFQVGSKSREGAYGAVFCRQKWERQDLGLARERAAEAYEAMASTLGAGLDEDDGASSVSLAVFAARPGGRVWLATCRHGGGGEVLTTLKFKDNGAADAADASTSKQKGKKGGGKSTKKKPQLGVLLGFPVLDQESRRDPSKRSGHLLLSQTASVAMVLDATPAAPRVIASIACSKSPLGELLGASHVTADIAVQVSDAEPCVIAYLLARGREDGVAFLVRVRREAGNGKRRAVTVNGVFIAEKVSLGVHGANRDSTCNDRSGRGSSDRNGDGLLAMPKEADGQMIEDPLPAPRADGNGAEDAIPILSTSVPASTLHFAKPGTVASGSLNSASRAAPAPAADVATATPIVTGVSTTLPVAVATIASSIANATTSVAVAAVTAPVSKRPTKAIRKNAVLVSIDDEDEDDGKAPKRDIAALLRQQREELEQRRRRKEGRRRSKRKVPLPASVTVPKVINEGEAERTKAARATSQAEAKTGATAGADSVADAGVLSLSSAAADDDDTINATTPRIARKPAGTAAAPPVSPAPVPFAVSLDLASPLSPGNAFGISPASEIRFGGAQSELALEAIGAAASRHVLRVERAIAEQMRRTEQARLRLDQTDQGGAGIAGHVRAAQVGDRAFLQAGGNLKGGTDRAADNSRRKGAASAELASAANNTALYGMVSAVQEQAHAGFKSSINLFEWAGKAAAAAVRKEASDEVGASGSREVHPSDGHGVPVQDAPTPGLVVQSRQSPARRRRPESIFAPPLTATAALRDDLGKSSEGPAMHISYRGRLQTDAGKAIGLNCFGFLVVEKGHGGNEDVADVAAATGGAGGGAAAAAAAAPSALAMVPTSGNLEALVKEPSSSPAPSSATDLALKELTTLRWQSQHRSIAANVLEVLEDYMEGSVAAAAAARSLGAASDDGGQGRGQLRMRYSSETASHYEGGTFDGGNATAATLLLPPQLVALIAAEARYNGTQLPPRLQSVFILAHEDTIRSKKRAAGANGAAAEVATAMGLAGSHYVSSGLQRSALPQSLEDGAIHWGVRL